MKDRWKLRAAELLFGIAVTGKGNPAVIPYTPAKTDVSAPERRELERTTPEREGVASGRLCKMYREIEAEHHANIHSVLIVRNGKVISECSRAGYGTNIRHLSHSMSKTLTGIAIGMLCDDGKLSEDTKLTALFPEYQTTDKRFGSMTVKHLLTMTSGVPFSEAGSVTEEEWTRAFFASKLSFAPGEMFAYNSMNSYILARTVTRISGKSLLDFLKERLFAPLGIKNVFWEEGPEGTEKGGWGVFLSAESWAKVGMMMGALGTYGGERILSEEWVVKATSTHANTPEPIGDFNYGYQLWVSRENDDFLFNGMLGQNVWVCPKNNIVAVVLSGNNEIFQACPTIEIIKRHLGGELDGNGEYSGITLTELREKEKSFCSERAWIKPKSPRRGITYSLGIRRRRPFQKQWGSILGSYSFARNNQSILPFFIRLMQNNYIGGIESFTLERAGAHLFFTSKEGGVDHRFEIGFYGYKETVLDFGGEKYIVRAIGDTVEDENHHIFYKIELIFPEMPNSRKIRITVSDDGRMVVRMTEMPNHKIAESLVEGIYATNPKLAFLVSLLERRLGDKFLNKKLNMLFSPTLVGANTSSPHYRSIIASENKKTEAEAKKSRSVAALIEKISNHEDDSD